jgi:DNA-directed RNA polymerase specialized sigma24 family protein
MADESDRDSQVSRDSARVMRAVLALMAADRDERIDASPQRRSEIVLADAGFSAREISIMTGRNYEAVRSALRRRTRNE